jgi:hypothetical protein
MRSDFSGARRFLERANEALRGSDDTSEQMRTAIDLLIEVAIRRGIRATTKLANVLPFCRGNADL